MSKGNNIIMEFEGFSENAYICPAGKVTIGFGNTYYEDGTPVKMGDKITRQRGEELFKSVVKKFEDQVREVVTSKINENQLGALVSFTYNLGIGNLKKSTLLKKINRNPHDPTIPFEFLKWVSPGTKFEKGLRRRRIKESELYFQTL